MHLESKLPELGTTIFTVMSQLAQQHDAINLSQGFPDFDCSPELIDLVYQSMKRGQNQYAPMAGLAELRERIAEKQFILHGSRYDPDSEITITAGGTQAIFTSLTAVLRPGDEVIIFEPAYDAYSPAVELLGGKTIAIELKPDNYVIDWNEVRESVSQRTRMIILNSPNNPSGSILSYSDILELSSIVAETNILILSDEVYEHLIYEGRKHLSLSAFPELKKRTFICASFGKLFHITGWKVGYCMGPEWLMKEFRKVHQFLVFSVNSAVQYALAEFLSNEANYLNLSSFFQQKRDLFRTLMLNTKFDLLPCSGSYFQCVKYSRITDLGDSEFARKLTIETGVAGIPISAFYTKGTDFGVLRFCFAKKQETLQKAVERLITI